MSMKKTHSWNKSVRLLRWLAGALLLTAFTVSCKANVSTPIAVSGVTLDKATVTLVEQETVTLKATVKPANATNKAVTWSSNKPDVAAVDKDGKVTAHKAGEAVITVKSEDGGKTASCTVKVTAKPPTTYKVTFSVDGTGGTLKAKAEGIAETETSPITIEQGKTVTFTAKPADGYEVEKWTVNGTTVANNVSTTYSHKVTTAVMVKVSFKALPPPAVAVTGVTLDKPTVSLVAGTSTTLTATVLPANATNKTVTWSSDKPAIASVDKNGTVTAHKAGEAVITVKSEDGAKTASCTVTVSLTEYVITYHLDGGSNHADNPAKYTIETETITLKPAEKADHIFFGWYASADFSGEKVTEIRKGSSGNKELYAKFIEMKMIDIAAVTNGTLGHANYGDNGEHTVSLTAYRIGETEVTQELWQAVMGNNPSEFKGAGNPPDGSEVQEKRPVESVNWYKCIAFCNELTKKVAELGESQCVYTVDGHTYGTADATAKKVPEMDMSKKGFRLPTEAEWEWAAKGGTEYKWVGTNEGSELENYAWYSANSNSKTHEVKQKQPNGYGLYDMSGNVWEWCWDWYSTLLNPLPEDYSGAASGDYRVIRGGSWNFNADYAARAYRDGSSPALRDDFLGLRVVSRP